MDVDSSEDPKERLQQILLNPPLMISKDKNLKRRKQAILQYNKIKSLGLWFANNTSLDEKRKAESFLRSLEKIEHHLRKDLKVIIPPEIQSYIAEIKQLLDVCDDKLQKTMDYKKKELHEHYRKAEESEALWDITHDAEPVETVSVENSQMMFNSNSEAYQLLKQLETAYQDYRDNPTVATEFNVKLLITEIIDQDNASLTNSSAAKVPEAVVDYAKKVAQRLEDNNKAAQEKIEQKSASSDLPLQFDNADFLPPPPGPPSKDG